MAMVVEELLPAVGEILGAELPCAELPCAELGWSMGSYGSLLFAVAYPTTFAAVAAASPALWQRVEDAREGAFDTDEDFRTHDVFAMRDAVASSTVRVDRGTDGGFLGAAKAFAQGLRSKNLGGFAEGFHDDACWCSIARAQLATRLRS